MRDLAIEAIAFFPELKEVRLFGSLARGEQTGLSDIDLFLVVESEEKNPLERLKPYYGFFAGRLEIGVDIITSVEGDLQPFKGFLGGSIVLAKK